MQLRQGVTGRILASIALLAFWILPIEAASPGQTLTGWQEVDAVFNWLSNVQDDSIAERLAIMLLLTFLMTLGGLVALISKRTGWQILGAIIGLTVWGLLLTYGLAVKTMADLFTREYVLVRPDLLQYGTYISIAAFVGVLLTPLFRKPSSPKYSALLNAPLLRCLTCGAYNTGQSRFCNACGAALMQSGSTERPKPLEGIQPQRFCTKCGATVGVQDTFCRSCGKPLHREGGQSVQ